MRTCVGLGHSGGSSTPRKISNQAPSATRLKGLQLGSQRSPLLARGLLRVPPNVFPTIDKARAAARSKFVPTLSESIPLSAAQPDALCAAPNRRAPGCARFGLAFFVKSRRSRAEARRNASCREPAPG